MMVSQVSYLRWTVSLGGRACATSLCSHPELGLWYVVCIHWHGNAVTWLGWTLALSRAAAAASGAYIAGTMIQGLIVLGYETYNPARWHGTLLYWAVILLSVLINVLGIRVFPHLETAALILHVVSFFALLVPLVYLAPQSSPSFVFRSFENSGGWSNDGISWCIGLLTSTYAMAGKIKSDLINMYDPNNTLGFDSACHMCTHPRS